MRALGLLLSLALVACGGTSAGPVAPAPEPTAVALAEVAEPEVTEPVAGPALGIGEAGGCAIRGRELRCWGPAVADPPDASRSMSLMALGSTVEVAEGTACFIDGGALRCFGDLMEDLRMQEIERLAAAGASDEEVEAVENASPYIVTFAEDAVDVSMAIGGLCWVKSDGLLGCSAMEGEPGPYVHPPAVDDAVRVAITDEHACVVRREGEVLCWGSDEIAIGASPGDSRSVVEHDLDATDVVTGMGFSCALSRDGRVTCWGDLVEMDAPGEELAWPEIEAVAISAGMLHACARTAGGRVWCAGQNAHGQLGDGTTESREVPVEATELRGAQALAAGADATCVFADERLRCVGNGLGGAFDGRARGPEWARIFTGARSLFLGPTGRQVCAVDESDQTRCVGHSPGTTGGLLADIRPHLPHGLESSAVSARTFEGRLCQLLPPGRLRCGERDGAPEPREQVAQIESGVRVLCARHENGDVFCHRSRTGETFLEGEGWQRVRELRGAVHIAVDRNGTTLCGALRNGRVRCLGRLAGAPLDALRGAVEVATTGRRVCVRNREGRATCASAQAVLSTVDDVRRVGFLASSQCFVKNDGSLDCRDTIHGAIRAPTEGVVELATRYGLLCVRNGEGEVFCRSLGVQGELGRVPEGVAIEAMEVDPFAPPR